MEGGAKTPGWIKDYWGIMVAGVAAVAYLVLELVDADIEAEPLAILFVAIPLGIWLLWRFWSVRPVVKGLASLAIVVLVAGLVYYVFRLSRPRFVIEALDTLDGDPNAYEVTDFLIDNQDKLQEHGVAITFTLQIRPIYDGNKQFGRVAAFVSGDGRALPQKTVWENFSGDSKTATVHLTLPELLEASGLKKNSDPPTNPFGPGEPPFQQSRLSVQIAREGDEQHPWAAEEIVVRNAPWESRSELVWRNDRREVDVYVKNLGGAGGFTFRYYLVRLKETVDSTTYVMGSGTEYVKAWYEPTDLVELEKDDFFTDTVAVVGDLIAGRYVIEAYPVKRQEYVELVPPASWEPPNLPSLWLFARAPVRNHPFVNAATLVDVQADQGWQDTGVEVQEGERVKTVQADGAWSACAADIPPHDGNGTTYYAPDQDAPLPHACVGAMIGRIGTDPDDIFLVGRCGEHVSQAQGKLFLRMNDKEVGDNSGFLTVQIIVIPP